jgi:hypothetical protein
MILDRGGTGGAGVRADSAPGPMGNLQLVTAGTGDLKDTDER